MIMLKMRETREVEWVGMKEQTCRQFKKSGNLSGFLRIGNTKRRTHETSDLSDQDRIETSYYLRESI